MDDVGNPFECNSNNIFDIETKIKKFQRIFMNLKMQKTNILKSFLKKECGNGQHHYRIESRKTSKRNF